MPFQFANTLGSKPILSAKAQQKPFSAFYISPLRLLGLPNYLYLCYLENKGVEVEFSFALEILPVSLCTSGKLSTAIFMISPSYLSNNGAPYEKIVIPM